MKTVFCIGLIWILFPGTGISQDSSGRSGKRVVKGKNEFYISSGWHRAWYTKSTIGFRNLVTADYDFKLVKAKGIDDRDLQIGENIDAPQWSVRIGYFFKSGWGLELAYDHAKYVLKNGQIVRMQGTINRQYYNNDTLIHPDFIIYDHTDGANYYMLNLIRKKRLNESSDKRSFDWILKAGAGPVIPKTNSRIMGMHYDERYHISGYVLGVENSIRHELLKNIFAEISLKTLFASYNDVLLYGGGRADQRWGTAMVLFTLTYSK